MRFMRWVFVIVTLLHVPLPLFAARDMMYTTFKFKRTKPNHVILSIGITFFAFLVPVLKPDVISVLGFFGGVFATAICLAFPFLLAIRIREKEGRGGIFVYKLVLTFVMFIIVGSAYLSLVPNVVPNWGK